MGLDRLISELRSGAWLNARRVRAYLAILALVNVVSLGWLLLSLNGGIDPQGRLLGTDFVSFWAAGTVVHAGASPYDPAIHAAAERMVWPGQSGYTAFFYPPIFLLWCWLLGLAGYFSALASWLVLTGGAWMAAVRGWSRQAGILPVLAFPPVLITLTHGQTSFLLAALLGGSVLMAVRGQAALAGVLFGLAAFKPQFGVLVPIVLLAARQWRIIGWAVATVATSALLASLMFGYGIWAEWLAVSGPAQQAMAQGAIGFGKMQSLFAAMRLLGFGTALAYGAQAALALLVAAMLAHSAWREGLTRQVGAAMLTGALLVTPFVLDYDFLLLVFPLVVLSDSTPRPWERTVAAIAFAMPAFARPLGTMLGVPIAPIIVLAVFLLLVRRMPEGRANLACA